MPRQIRQYDRQRHDEMVAQEAVLSQQIQELREQLNEYAESDAAPDSAGHRTYMVRADRYIRTREDRAELREELRAMALLEPERVHASRTSMLTRFLQRGFNGISAEEREAHTADPADFADAALPMMGGAGVEGITIQGATTSDGTGTSSGQELVEETIVPEVVERLVDFGGLDMMARSIVTGTGNELRWPQADNSANKGEILGAQATDVNAQDLAAFGVVTFNARTASSKPIRITREMLTDGIIDVGSYAEDEAVRRMGRAWDDEFTDEGTGGGTRAWALKQVAQKGVDQATADTLVYTDIVNLIYSLNRAYRVGRERGEGGRSATMGSGRKGFLITDGAEKALMNLKDGEDRPLWIPSIREGEQDRILKWPYEVTTAIEADHMSAPGTAFIWFGDFNYFGIRTVGSIEIFRFFDSRTAQNNTIEILGFSRRDARAMGAQGGGAAGTTEAIKFLAAA